jgi:glucose-6-phosphate isomerase
MRVLLSLFHEHRSHPSGPHFQRFLHENVEARLRSLDTTARGQGLPALDPAADPLVPLGMEIDSSGRVTKNSYGVFSLSWQARDHPEWPGRVMAEIQEIRARIQETHRRPLRYLIWAGMGGSIEDKSMYQAVGLLRRGVRFYALDSTDPAKLKFILADLEHRTRLPLPAILRSTLVVGMAMGMTSYEPVVNLERLSALYERHRIDSRPNFLYMTLPGSLLDQFAGPRGYRRVELQLDGANTTAGRHSGPLTRGSLYPLALAGADLSAWIAGTFLEEEEILQAWQLAAFLHAQGEAGRDKVGLLLPRPWSGASLWTKQDFEESLGKREDLGIKIVIQEKPRLADYRSPRDPAQDRLFLAVRIKGVPDANAEKVSQLRRAGYPVAQLTLPAGTPLSRYMQFVHYTVFGLGYLRGMNFVTQPSVELYKGIANRVHAEAGEAGGIEKTGAWRCLRESPRQGKWRGVLTLIYDSLPVGPEVSQGTAPAIYASVLKNLAQSGRVQYGELTFFGDTRYQPKGRLLRKSLDRAAARLFRGSLKMPADVYEGPAMNHSYHEMIIGHGKCFSTVLLAEAQDQLPAADYRAGYHVAQFLATRLALQQRGRPVAALLIKDLGDKSIGALDEFFQQAASALR